MRWSKRDRRAAFGGRFLARCLIAVFHAVSCLFLVIPAASQASAPAPQAASAPPAPQQFAVTIYNGKPVVRLEVGGTIFPFVIDTGANRALHLTPEVMAKLPQLKRTGRTIQSFDLAGKVQESAEFVVPGLVMNGIAFGDVTGNTLVPWGLEMGQAPLREVPISVIGLPLFARKPFVFDYAGRSLRFGAPAAAQSGWRALAHEASDEGLVAAFGNQRASYRLVLDSGASTSVVKQRQVDAMRDRAQPCDLKLGPGRSCSYVAVAFKGGRAFNALVVDLPDALRADGIAGADFFQHYAVYADLARRQLAVRASDLPVRTSASRTR